MLGLFFLSIPATMIPAVETTPTTGWKNNWITMTVPRGWMLWSMYGVPTINPYHPTLMTAKDLLDANPYIKAISRLDTVVGVYKSFARNYPPAYDFVLNPGEGYFVYNDRKALTLGMQWGPMEYKTVKHPLHNGWNLIGICGKPYENSANSFPAPIYADQLFKNYIKNCTPQAISRLVGTWINGTFTFTHYESYVVGYPSGFNFIVQPLQGYFLNVKGDGGWLEFPVT